MLDKFLNAMRLNSDDDDYYDDDYYDEDEEEYEDEKPRKSGRSKYKDDLDNGTEERKLHSVKTSSKITPMRPSKRQGNSSGMEVCVVKPRSLEEAREITDTLLINKTVVLNVEGLDVDTAQRIIDFSSGSCYAIDGNLQKISNYIFIITPPNVDISCDLGELTDIVDTFDLPTMQAKY